MPIEGARLFWMAFAVLVVNGLGGPALVAFWLGVIGVFAIMTRGRGGGS